MKKCPRCLEDKPKSEFHKDPRRIDGLTIYCGQCNNQRVKEWKEKNPDKVKEWRSNNPDYRKEWGEKNPDHNLQRKYGLSQADYNKLLEDQNYVCAICGGVNKSGKALSVDHDHSCCAVGKGCGKCIRQLLCDACNRGLGHFKDNPAFLRAAAEYVENHSQDHRQ